LPEDRLKIRYDEKDAPKMMDWEMARNLIRRNHIIGNHTFSHPNVAHVSPETQVFEIEESHRLLSEHLNHHVEHFSYPHPCLKPQHDEHSDDLVQKLGYKTIVLTDYGWVRENTSPFLIPRLSLAQMETNTFVWRLETAFARIQT
jgi:peptidoglycan/xylan/chitin deacetylase (PgdA/CDA1 family)